MAYCLIRPLADKFKKMLVSGEINPERLNAMTSKERNAFFKDMFGEHNARNINALFESKLLLKNKELGMINWAKQLTGIKPEVRNDMIKRIQSMIGDAENGKFILNAESEAKFMEDLASKRLGVDVSFEEAQKITELSKVISDKKTLMEKDITNTENRIDYGRSLIDMYDYVAELKPGKSTMEQAINVANLPRAAMSTLDFSAPFRQGFGLVSRKEFWNNFKPMFKSAFDEKAFRDIQAEIITRPSYPAMKKSGLRVTGLGDKLSDREEAFMTTLLDKIPGVRGSERAYTGFLSKLRADSFDNLLRTAELAGEDVSASGQVVKDLASVVNNFTGAGKLITGAVDTASPLANAFFFSPRKIAATIQKFNPVNYLNPKISPTARKEAFRNLIGMLGTSASILGLAKMSGAEVEVDPRSSDFGKIKIGDTRIDVTGGEGNYLVLLARLISGQTKSTTSDITRKLGESFGAPTRGDTLVQYFRNKLSPVASFAADFLYGKDATGAPFDVKKETINRLYPMIISTAIDAAKNDPAMIFPSVMADMFGFGTSTYDNSIDWTIKTGKELEGLKQKIGEEEFSNANNDYNVEIKKQTNSLLKSEEYKKMSDEDKLKAVNKMKADIKSKIFGKYDYYYSSSEKVTAGKPIYERIMKLYETDKVAAQKEFEKLSPDEVKQFKSAQQSIKAHKSNLNKKKQ